MLSNKDILNQFAQGITPELRKVAGNSFGKTIGYTVTDTTLEITASPFIRVLIDGRKPTSANAKRGNPTLQQRILEWIEAKGITPRSDKKGRIPTRVQLSWMISRSIHTYGTLLYRRGGGNNIFDTVITESRISSLLALFENKYRAEVLSMVTDNLKNLNNDTTN